MREYIMNAKSLSPLTLDDITGKEMSDFSTAYETTIVSAHDQFSTKPDDGESDQDKILRLQQECNELKRSRTEYQEVRRMKIIVLREMLITHSKIDPQVAVRESIHDNLHRKAEDPEEIFKLTQCWMTYHEPEKLTNCDINARFCWATLCGGKDYRWLLHGSNNDLDFSCSLHINWKEVRRQWFSDSAKTMMIVRFIDHKVEHDGHSVVSYKYMGKVYTFQAYFDVCKLNMSESDIFASDKQLTDKIIKGDPLNASDFGLPISIQSSTYRLFKYFTA